MKDRKILVGANTLLIAAVLFSPITVVGSINIETIEQAGTFITPNIEHEGGYHYHIAATGEDVIWDNNISYVGLIASQLDEVYPFYALAADDFLFEEETVIDDVHWVGGYWNGEYEGVEFDWNITFYEDRGDGEAPGEIYAGPFIFPQNQCNPIVLNDTGTVIYYGFSVNYSEYLHFTGGQKYWISIQGLGLFPPQSAIGYHFNPVKLHQAVFLSHFFGYDDWNNSEVVTGDPADLCFQLTKQEDNTSPTVEITKPEKAFYLNDGKIFDRLFGFPLIIGDITIEVAASDNKEIKKVEFYAGLYGDELLGTDTTAPYNFTWQRDRIRLIHLHKLKVVACDWSENTANDSMLVKKFL